MAEQTLRSYNPSWADKLASYMLDHTSGSPEARNFVGGMMGTTGLGKQGMGLVDAVPVVGQALQAQEAYQNNDPKGMAMAVLPMAPAPAKSYAGALGRMARDQSGWIAWHGSPHEYGNIDLARVGSGEGAQAYGHGYYVAEHPEVAKSYKDQLAGSGKGYMYKLDVKPDQSRFLDWEKPIGQQPHIVERFEDNVYYHPDKLGEEFYNDLTRGRARQAAREGVGSDFLASEYLQQRGIPGVRYLDQGSRELGGGTSNFVVFNPDDVQILERNGIQLGMPPAQPRYVTRAGVGDPNGMMNLYSNKIEEVPISWLRKLPGNNLRVPIDDLKASIESEGLREPLIVNVGKSTRTAQLGEGNHRLAALEQLGYTHAPVRVSVGREWGSGKMPNGTLDADLIPQPNEYFSADAAPSSVFRSLGMPKAR